MIKTGSTARLRSIQTNGASAGEGAIISKRTFVSRIVISLTNLGIADGPTWRYVQFNSSKRGESPPDRLDQVRRLPFRLAQLSFQDLAGFLLHRVAVFGSADFELAFGGFWKLTDGDTSHAINDSIAIIDGTSELTGWRG